MPEKPLPTYDELKADKTLTAESLQAKLNAYHEAFAQEFEAKAEDNVEEATLDYFKKEIPNAAAQIVWLAHNATSEAVQKDCLKFIIQQGLSDAKRDGDPLKKLLEELTSQPAPAPAP